MLSGLRHGGGDPCWRRTRDGTRWWATRTPQGNGLLALTSHPGLGEVQGQAWGPGAQWLLDGLPELLGAHDDPSGFRPDGEHPVLVRAWRTHSGLRVPRSRRVADAFAAACIEQRVTGKEAFFAWARLVRRFGEPAPGAPADPGGPAAGIRVAPSPAAWLAIPQWEWLRAGVDLTRRRALLTGMSCADGLERTLTREPDAVDAALTSLPGVGRWTSAEVRQRAHGDPDAFSFGDYHVAKNVSFALTGSVLDDDGCAEVIERYRGHRFRVQRLIELSGVARPRRAPRMTLPTHTPSVQR